MTTSKPISNPFSWTLQHVILLLCLAVTLTNTTDSAICDFMLASGFPDNWTCNQDGCSWYTRDFSCLEESFAFLSIFITLPKNCNHSCPSLLPTSTTEVEITIFTYVATTILSFFLIYYFNNFFTKWRVILLFFLFAVTAIIIEISLYFLKMGDLAPLTIDLVGGFSTISLYFFVWWAEPDFYLLESFLFYLQMRVVIGCNRFVWWGEEVVLVKNVDLFDSFCFDFISIDCLYGEDTPFIILGILVGLWLLLAIVTIIGIFYYQDQKYRSIWQGKCGNIAAFMAYTFYFPLVYLCLKKFGCNQVIPTVIVMLIILVTIPVVLLVVGYIKRHHRTEPTVKAVLGFLYEDFQYNFWWMRSFITGRKLIMAFIVTFTQYGPWLTIVLFFNMAVVAYFQPYRSHVKAISFLSFRTVYIEVGMGNLIDLVVSFCLLFSLATPNLDFVIVILDIFGIFCFYIMMLWSARQKYLKTISENTYLLSDEMDDISGTYGNSITDVDLREYNEFYMKQEKCDE